MSRTDEPIFRITTGEYREGDGSLEPDDSRMVYLPAVLGCDGQRLTNLEHPIELPQDLWKGIAHGLGKFGEDGFITLRKPDPVDLVSASKFPAVSGDDFLRLRKELAAFLPPEVLTSAMPKAAVSPLALRCPTRPRTKAVCQVGSTPYLLIDESLMYRFDSIPNSTWRKVPDSGGNSAYYQLLVAQHVAAFLWSGITRTYTYPTIQCSYEAPVFDGESTSLAEVTVTCGSPEPAFFLAGGLSIMLVGGELAELLSCHTNMLVMRIGSIHF